MAIGTAVSVLAMMLTSVATKYYQYMLAQGLLFGLGVGMMCVIKSFSLSASDNLPFQRFYPSLAAITTQFTTYRATALGIAAAGSSLGTCTFLFKPGSLLKSVS